MKSALLHRRPSQPASPAAAQFWSKSLAQDASARLSVCMCILVPSSPRVASCARVSAPEETRRSLAPALSRGSISFAEEMKGKNAADTYWLRVRRRGIASCNQDAWIVEGHATLEQQQQQQQERRATRSRVFPLSRRVCCRRRRRREGRETQAALSPSPSPLRSLAHSLHPLRLAFASSRCFACYFRCLR